MRAFEVYCPPNGSECAFWPNQSCIFEWIFELWPERTPLRMRKVPNRRLMLLCRRQAFINRMGDCDQVQGAQGWGFVKAVSQSLTIISNGVQSEDAILYIQVSRRNLPRLKYSS